MEKFLSRYRSLVTGVLTGFDRVVFHGILQRLMRHDGMSFMLQDAKVKLLDFKKFALAATEQVKEASLAEARRTNRPIRFLGSPSVDKQKLARKVLAENPVEQGLICVFKAIEPCMTFEYQRSANREERGLRLHPGKCLHLYHYWLDPRFGFMNARIQTWFPFNIQICINGREWLARQLLRKGQNNFKRDGNCFTWLSNLKLAQRLMDDQLDTDWPRALNAIARSLNPKHQAIFRSSPMNYYWTAYQTELATDVLFRDPQSLADIFPPLVRYAMGAFKSPDVMRFLAQKAPGNFTGEIVTSFKDRAEGVRVKHWLRGNSIKMYDKAGSVFRVETTIGDPTDFKVFRPRHDDPDGKHQWLQDAQGCGRSLSPRRGLTTIQSHLLQCSCGCGRHHAMLEDLRSRLPACNGPRSPRSCSPSYRSKRYRPAGSHRSWGVRHLRFPQPRYPQSALPGCFERTSC